jgi:two-component system, LytTR family, response regulator
MRILILEDEPIIADSLERSLLKLFSEINIVGKLPSVRETNEWFQKNEAPDLILADIQLSDDISFKALEKLNNPIPIIFTTAFDEFALRAFRLNSIDYLLKPIDEQELTNAIEKFHQIKTKYALPLFNQELKGILSGTPQINKYKRRFLVYSGKSVVPIDAEQAGYFSKQEIIFLTDNLGKQFVTEYRSLDEIQDLVDPIKFYRANRQFLINSKIIDRFDIDYTGKLHLFVNIPNSPEIIVSKDKAADFKRWIEQ